MGMFVVTPSSTQSMIPLLTTTTTDGDDFITGRNRTDMIKFWHHHQYKTKNGTDEIQFDQHHQDVEGEGGAATCQDCGNQAKKDCTNGRCRTCCRSRGFECSSHVKSTWVPSYRRRDRQMVGGGGGGGAPSGSTSGAKKPRVLSSAATSHTSTSNTPPTPSRQEASRKESLPGQATAAAVFKCVRVTSVEDGDDEYAYQAVVKIGGHVFKGFLYDQGVEPRGRFPSLSELHLGGGTSGAGGGGGGRNGGSSTIPLVHPSDVYGSATFFCGSTNGNNIN